MYQAIVTYRNGQTANLPLTEDSFRGGIRLSLQGADYTEVESVTFPPYHEEIREGDAGYFVVSHSTQYEDCMLTRFEGHKDGDSFVGKTPFFPMFGVRHTAKSYLAVFTGFPYNCHVVAEKRTELMRSILASY